MLGKITVALMIAAALTTFIWAIAYSIASDNRAKDNCKARGGHVEAAVNGEGWICVSNEDPNRIIRL